MLSRKYISKQQTLIINADDYGCCESIDEGILQLLKAQKIKSLSIIVNQINSGNAIKRLLAIKQTSPSIFHQTSFGLHFNLTRGRALSQQMRNSQFVQNGCFVKQKVMKAVPQPNGIPRQAIQDQLTAQIQLFISLLKRRPSHIDSHNYLHIFTHIAQAITPILTNFGIYRIRNTNMPTLSPQNKQYEINFNQTMSIYLSSNIVSTDIFIGHEDAGNLSVSKIKQTMKCHLQQKQNVSIELMCHPGYPTNQQLSWMGRQDRLLEKQQLEGQQFRCLRESIGGLSSYFDLEKATEPRCKRLLIYSKLVKGTGNLTTSMRLKHIFETLGYEVYTWSVQHQLDFHVEVQDLSAFLFGFSISLIIGVNVSRSAQIIHEAVFSKDRICMQVPYILIIAGTDANISFKHQQTLVEYRDSLNDCQCLISLSQAMTAITQHALSTLNIHKSIYTINQSAFTTFNHQTNLHTTLLPLGISQPYILYPTSFRKIKCIQHILSELNHIITHYNIQVILIGPIIELEYYEHYRSQLGKIKYLGKVSQESSIQLIRNAFVVINTSLQEGMSCSILQAFSCKIPVIARDNSGNSELIEHKNNGLLYTHPSQFLQNFTLLLSDAELRYSLIQQAYKLVTQKYSFQQQLKRYGEMIASQIDRKMMVLQLQNEQIKVFNQHFVHNTSAVNNNVLMQVEPSFKREEIKLLDLGCGTGIFSLIFILKAKTVKCHVYLTDITAFILSNALFNFRQSYLKNKIQSIVLQQSNLFESIDSQSTFDAILFNPPQTPFRQEHSRPDKNGGSDSIKYFQPALQHISTFTNDFKLYLMHSQMAWPSKCLQLFDKWNLSVRWRSGRGVHAIHKEEYNKMQSDLWWLIMQHWKMGRAEIQLKDDVLYVPIQLCLLQRRQKV